MLSKPRFPYRLNGLLNVQALVDRDWKPERVRMSLTLPAFIIGSA